MAIILVALGSNRRHGRHGPPHRVLRAALARLPGLRAASPIIDTAPMGPGSCRYANAVAVIDWAGDLLALLALLKGLEQDFGRRRGRRWGDRVLDLDIIGAGAVQLRRPGLVVPHPAMTGRRFVLDPLVAVAPGWRHPRENLTARQLRARAMRPKGLPRA